MSRRWPRTATDEQRDERRSPLTYRAGDILTDPAGGRCEIVAVKGGRLLCRDGSGFTFIIGRRRIDGGRWQHAAANAPLPGALRQTAAVGLDPSHRQQMRVRQSGGFPGPSGGLLGPSTRGEGH